jgi:hypothetical protein
MKRFNLQSACAMAFGLSMSAAQAATVEPIQDAFSNVFPTLTEQSLNVFRSAAPSPWYTSFDLLTKADVKLGALTLPGGFDLTSIRLVTLDGANVAFGTDTFPVSPFSNPIEALVVANALPAGQYALEVSGSGNSTNIFGDIADFSVRLQVMPSSGATPVQNVTASPVQANFGNVFPTLTEQSLNVFRTSAQRSWYTSFNLLAQADVKLGALTLPGGFDLTSIRLVTLDGANVEFGTDTFPVNPFSNPIEALVVANALPAGQYALEVSGSGNSANIFGDTADFSVRLQVTPVPEPQTCALMLTGLGFVGYAASRRRRRSARGTRATVTSPKRSSSP